MYTLVGISPLVALTPAPVNPIVLAAPIAVQPGDLIGLSMAAIMQCEWATSFGSQDTIGYGFGSTPALMGTRAMLTFTGYRLNVAATVELATPPPPPVPTDPVPTSKDQCNDGGWQHLTDSTGAHFKNQGDCVSYVATDGGNAAGPPANPAGTPGNAAGNPRSSGRLLMLI